jgi:predicted RNA binding protein YcfA (HicA-like mRNA interferase family)
VTEKLPSLSTREVLAALRSYGFMDAPIREKGSHHALMRTDAAGHTRLVIVPERRTIPTGTLLSIMKQSGLTREEFLSLFY